MSLHMQRYYRREPEENWFVREDVAGYEYPQAGYNYRIGVTRETMQTQDDILPLFDIMNTSFNKSITRNIARAVITKSLLSHPPESLQLLLSTELEAIISLEDSGNPDLADCYQIILGRNDRSRQTPSNIVLNELAIAERIFAEAKTRPFSPALLNQLKGIYSFERITDKSNPELLKQYGRLARTTFGYRSDELDLLLDEDTILIVAVAEQSKQHTVAGGAFAWRDRTYLKRNGRDVMLDTYEISGAVVRKEHSGKGVYKGILVTLLNFLAHRADSVDVVFSFSNIEECAVLAVAAQMGRVLVTETARQFHLSIKPAMQQNIVKGKYVDDIVTYIPGKYLRRQY